MKMGILIVFFYRQPTLSRLITVLDEWAGVQLSKNSKLRCLFLNLHSIAKPR